jgi:hypothetical protein
MTSYSSFLLHVNSVTEDEEFVAARRGEVDFALILSKVVEPLVVRKAGGRILRRFFVGEKGMLRRNHEATIK